MENKALISKSDTKKAMAIEYFVLQPNMSKKEISEKLDIPIRTLVSWCSNPDFADAVWKRTLEEFSLQLPAVTKSIFNEAAGGNVQAQRLAVELMGKLVKNQVNIIVSPFEQFMKEIKPNDNGVREVKVEDIPEIKVEDVEVVDNSKPKETPKQEKVRNFKEIQKEISKQKRNLKQKEWYRWRKRAEAVGVEPLKSKRPTPLQRKEWENSIIAAEKLADTQE